MNTSLRRRLFLWLSVSILVTALADGALSFRLSYSDANELQDTQLVQIASLLSHQPSIVPTARLRPRTHEEAEAHLVIKRLGPEPAGPDPSVDLALPDSLMSGLQTLERSGVNWRAIVSQNDIGQRFAVAQRMTIRDEVARDSAVLTLLPQLLLVPLLLLLVGVVLRQAFEPMTTMSKQVDRLDGNRLSALNERQVPLEALPLVQAMNRLMHRLDETLERQRRMVSDAAHELRTPVAVLRVQADNLAHIDLPAEAEGRMDALRAGLTRMSSLIDQLLSLARVQSSAPTVVQRLALDSLVRAAIEETLPMAQARGVDLGCLRLDAAFIEGDALHAYALVRNVVDNAVRYTPKGGKVDVSMAADKGTVELVVEDTGPGVREAELERVFQPFVRGLETHEPGSGLGLAIVRSASLALGGKIEVGGRADGTSGLRFVYRQSAA